MAQVRVGRVEIPLDTAAAWIAEYTDGSVNISSDRPYAFPAYDRYDGGTTEPARLTDGDLLAPSAAERPNEATNLLTGFSASAAPLKPAWPTRRSQDLRNRRLR